jgi:hypothetical protein
MDQSPGGFRRAPLDARSDPTRRSEPVVPAPSVYDAEPIPAAARAEV